MGGKRWWNILIFFNSVMHGLKNFKLIKLPIWYIPPSLSNVCYHFLIVAVIQVASIVAITT
jgi:hypothetical protein